MAFDGTPGEELAWFFDDIELLPALMMEQRNTDDFFGEYLKETCIKFKSDHIFSQYQKSL